MIDNRGLTNSDPHMTSTHPEATPATSADTPQKTKTTHAERRQSVQPVLEQLFTLYPRLFGAEFLPLKRGIFQDLLEKHPDVFQRDSLKAALGVHTRSTRYLQCVAAGKQRHDLQGVAVEDVAPEHVYAAIVELFRRRQSRTQDDLRPQFRTQLMAAYEASGLSRDAYMSCVARTQPNDAQIGAVLEEALELSEQKLARQEALQKAFESSGKSLEAFAAMYGLKPRDVKAALARKPRVSAMVASAS